MKSTTNIWSLNITHEYYKAGTCKDFRIKPTHATKRLLEGKRWELRHGEGQLKILSKNNNLKVDDPLHFALNLENPNFFHFTDLSYKPGQILWYGCKGVEILKEQYRIVGSFFTHVFEWENADPELRVRSLSGEEVYRAAGTYNNQKLTFKPELPAKITGRFKLSIEIGNKLLHDEIIFVDKELWKEKSFGVVEILPQEFETQTMLKIHFKSLREPWKFFFISKSETDEVIILKDENKTTDEGRYSNLKITFVERPVGQAIDGSHVTCFETGELDKSEKFIPQMIPLFEENKRNLNLYRFAGYNGESEYRSYKYKKGKKGFDHDEEEDNDESYFHYKCLEKSAWDKKLKRHILKKGKKIYEKYKLKKKGIKLLADIPNPSPNHSKKEVYIYI